MDYSDFHKTELGHLYWSGEKPLTVDEAICILMTIRENTKCGSAPIRIQTDIDRETMDSLVDDFNRGSMTVRFDNGIRSICYNPNTDGDSSTVEGPFLLITDDIITEDDTNEED